MPTSFQHDRRGRTTVRRAGPLFLLAVGLAGLGLSAGEARGAPRGTAGLDRVPFRAQNHSASVIECHVAIAHWYSAQIGEAAPGEAVVADFWSDPASGAIYLLNAEADRMPVQALFCGLGGRAASTRSDVLLSRRAGVAEPMIDLDCRGVSPNGRLACSRAEDR